MLEQTQSGQSDVSPSAKQIPDNIYECAAQHKLGMPLMRIKSTRLLLICIGNLIALISLVIILGFSIKIYVDAVFVARMYPLPANNPIGQGFQDTRNALFFEVISFIVIMVELVWSFIVNYESYRQPFYVCSGGLLHLQGKKEEAIRWDMVEELYGSSKSPSILVSNENIPFFISQYRTKALNSMVAHEATERLLLKAIAFYEAGVPLPFDNLQVVRKGINDHGHIIPWEEIEEVREKRGKLAIKSRGKWQQWPGLKKWTGTGRYVRKIRKKGVTNIPILVGLVVHIIQTRNQISPKTLDIPPYQWYTLTSNKKLHN